MTDQPVILFDGVCNFCNSTVNFVIKRDKKSVLKFAALQSAVAQKLLPANQLASNDLRSFVLIENDKIYLRSEAALRVCRHLTGLWPLMYSLIIIPEFIRDGIYNRIAKNRYKWFGKKEECMVPAADIKHRFLNDQS